MQQEISPGSQGFYGIRRDILLKLNQRVQSLVVKLAAPLLVLLYGTTALLNPVWQNIFALLGVVVMIPLWLLAYRLCLRGRLEASVLVFIIAAFVFICTAGMVNERSAPTLAMVSLTLTVYASLFGRRLLLISVVLSFVSICGYEVMRYLHLWDYLSESPIKRFFMNSAFATLIVPLMGFLLRRGQIINDDLFRDIQQTGQRQAEAIRAVDELTPVFQRAVKQIREISTGLSAQANEQAAATTEASTSLGQINEMAEQTALSATKTRSMFTLTRDEALKWHARFQEVAQGFTDVVRNIEHTRTEFDELGERMQSIGDILTANRNIGKQIRILSINAAIEAQKAGEYGLGFNMVALHLRELIREVDENLIASRSLVDQIRSQVGKSTQAIRTGSKELTRYFTELKDTGIMLNRTAESIQTTSARLDSISSAAQMQQASLSEMRRALEELDITASELQASADTLVEVVRHIEDAQRRLVESH